MLLSTLALTALSELAWMMMAASVLFSSAFAVVAAGLAAREMVSSKPLCRFLRTQPYARFNRPLSPMCASIYVLIR